jgi:autotransporter-associated beta strand protein
VNGGPPRVETFNVPLSHRHKKNFQSVTRLEIFLALLFLLKISALAQTYLPNVAYFDRSNYVEYVAGDLPVIISAPHGGALTPSEIPDRQDDGSDPNFTTVTDSYTEETAFALQGVFASYFGHVPHVIVCQLKRTKIDCNRSLDEGVYQTNTYATIAWNDFQNWINTASNSAVAQSGRGFYIDQHGQGHTIQRLELGYLLTASQLTNTDAKLNSPTYAAQSSIRTLATIVSNKFSMPFSQILRGTNSFGGLMEARGFPCVPNPDMPNPGNGTSPIVYPGDQNSYFDGGYNTAVHGSQTGGGPVDSLQIEANMTGVRDTAANRTNYALAVAQTLDYFFTNYYGIDLRISAPSIWTSGKGKFSTASNWSNNITPVAGNFVLFTGAAGAVTNNLPAFTTGTGKMYAMLFDAGANGTFTNYGNPISLVAGITNFSAFPQIISNNLTLLAPQTFAANSGALNFFGNVTNAGFKLSFNSATNLTVNGVISGAGSLNKSGNGILTLNSANTFSGATTNFSGTLLANNSFGNANGSGALFVNSGATLSGTGIVSGPVSISGNLAPGNSVGILTVTNGLIFTNGGSYLWTLAANSITSPGVNFDQVVLSGGGLILNSNSPLVISFANSATAPATNNAFWQSPRSWKIILLGAAVTNFGLASFSVISNNNFSAGKFTSSADVAGNVYLNFLPTPPPLITPQAGLGTTNMNISWGSVTGVTYQIQFSTNLAPANWLPLANILATNANTTYSDTSPAAPSRFYRVAIP